VGLDSFQMGLFIDQSVLVVTEGVVEKVFSLVLCAAAMEDLL
jgi:hypothetical protein